MSEQTQAPKAPRKLADGIYEGDLILVDLGEGNLFRGWAQDLLLSSDGKPFAFKLDTGMIELEKIKALVIGEVNYVTLEDRIAKIKELEEANTEAEATVEAE